jgi:glycosyltransferase involved in cell wall biosynthesis
MKLSIIIPAYNEENTISYVLNRIKNLVFPVDFQIDKEIILVNDGSTDKTSKIIREFGNDDAFKVITLHQNLGKGSAIKTGLEHVVGDYVIIQDADLELDPKDIAKLVERIFIEDSEIIYGSRFHSLSKISSKVPWLIRTANKILTQYTNLLFGCRLTDMATCYKLINTDIIKKINLKCTGFEFEPEITAKLLRLGYKIIEVPVSYSPRSYEEGKKIGWVDGFKYLYILTKFRLIKKNAFVRI